MANNNQIAVKKRLIYAEDLFEPVDFTVLHMGGRSQGKTMAMYEQLFRKRVEMAPTIDAVEVVHAHWAHLGGDEWCCTACGEVIHTEGSWEKPDKKFCYECGAKMDLEEYHG